VHLQISMYIIIESFELEGTFKGQLVQLRGTPTDTSGAQSPVQTDLECLQGWDLDGGNPHPFVI